MFKGAELIHNRAPFTGCRTEDRTFSTIVFLFVFVFPLRFVHTSDISRNSQWMDTHLFVLWTGETIRFVWGFFLIYRGNGVQRLALSAPTHDPTGQKRKNTTD